jgi:hypothetical protein
VWHIKGVMQARTALIDEVQGALRELHWKDFETLVDLLFRQGGLAAARRGGRSNEVLSPFSVLGYSG